MESEQGETVEIKKPSEKRKKLVIVKKGKNVEKSAENDEKTENHLKQSKKRGRCEVKGTSGDESVLSTSEEATLKLLKHVGK